MAFEAGVVSEAGDEVFSFGGRNAREAFFEILHERLGEEDVAGQGVDEVLLAEGIGLVVGEFLAEGFLDRFHNESHLLGGGAPGIDAQAGFFLDEGFESLKVGRVGVDVDEALEADVLVRPNAPAGVVFAEDIELIDEDVVSHVVFFGVAEVDGAEFADPDGSIGLAHVFGALQEGFFEIVFVDEDAARGAGIIAAFVEAGERVVVTGVDGVGPDFLEDVKFGGVAVAIEEQEVVGVDLSDGIVEAFIEGVDDGAGRDRRVH